jgi:hypothetical protein
MCYLVVLLSCKRLAKSVLVTLLVKEIVASVLFNLRAGVTTVLNWASQGGTVFSILHTRSDQLLSLVPSIAV